MSELRAQLHEWREAIERVLPPWWTQGLAAARDRRRRRCCRSSSRQTSGFLNAQILALAYVGDRLGLNVVVGFAGLLDLGYVAFFAIGAYAVGLVRVELLLQRPRPRAASPDRPHAAGRPPQLHPLVILAAILVTAVAGSFIGLPTLRLRGDYIAIVTLAFGEIIRVFALNGTASRSSGGR